ncbi:MAG: ABC transporter permease, partial [Thermoplasmata archaeon]
YLARKAVYVVVTVFLIASLNFFIFQILPGDPTRVLIPRGGGSTNLTGGLRQQLIHQWGLDLPITQRFVIYMGNLLQGNLGTSITYRPGVPVLEVIGNRLLTTLVLVGVATALTAWLGLILGRFAGWRRGRPSDVAITLGGLTGYSMPTFWISLVLQFFLGVQLGLFPVQGERDLLLRNPDLLTDLLDRAYHLVLPVLTFVLSNFAIFTLTLRNSLTDVLSEDYMLTARAKGLTDESQLRLHALPNARLPVVTVGAFYAGWIVSGAIVIEIVFGFQGIGRLEWDAVLNLDFPLMSGIFLVATLGVVIANAVADVLYVILDPRVREA